MYLLYSSVLLFGVKMSLSCFEVKLVKPLDRSVEVNLTHICGSLKCLYVANVTYWCVIPWQVDEAVYVWLQSTSTPMLCVSLAHCWARPVWMQRVIAGMRCDSKADSRSSEPRFNSWTSVTLGCPQLTRRWQWHSGHGIPESIQRSPSTPLIWWTPSPSTSIRSVDERRFGVHAYNNCFG